jgi:hypothetical protein
MQIERLGSTTGTPGPEFLLAGVMMLHHNNGNWTKKMPDKHLIKLKSKYGLLA